MSMQNWLPNKPVPYFLSLCFIALGADWCFLEAVQLFQWDWLWDKLKLISTILYGAGPALAAWFTYLKFGTEPYPRIREQLTRFPVKSLWWGYALGLPILLWLIPYVLELILSGQATPISNLYWFIVPMLIVGSLQEIGWRGFLLPYWLDRLPPAQAAVRVAACYVLILIPFWLISGPGLWMFYLTKAIHFFTQSFLLTALWMATRNLTLVMVMQMLFTLGFYAHGEFDMEPVVLSVIEVGLSFGIFVLVVQTLPKNQKETPAKVKQPATNQPGQKSG
ncbi:MAG: CPBP family glutamic-type intramembrane protease [Bacteroidota bacterium]